MKAFVEFGRETSDTKSCFHFIGLFCYKALTVNAEKTCKKRYLKIVPIKCQR